jgi:hypothetical protein
VITADVTQAELDAKEDGLGVPATDGQVLTSTHAGVRSWEDAKVKGIKDQNNNNVISYRDWTTSSVMTEVGYVGGYVNIEGVLHDPLVIKNDTAIQALGVGGAPTRNLFSRWPDNAVVLGDENTQTVIRGVSGYEPALRIGAYGSTVDYKIWSDMNKVPVVTDSTETDDNARAINELLSQLQLAGIMG